MEDFKVSLESLHTAQIKEISYEGEEIYQERPTLSQRLTELAHRIDFSESLEGEGAEPAAKRSTQKWPWEYAHSKLKQALTEISVLSDVLQISQSHRHYIMLDPVVAQPSASVTPGYQYVVKKKALGVAAGILRNGTKSLLKASSHGEREFHKALSSLRQRWRLRRTPHGSIVGDLSYLSAGSQYAGVVMFEVQKGTGVGEGSGDVISVTVPRELRGRSEIAVFLSEVPVKDIPSLDHLQPSPFDDFSRKHRNLPPWELKLVAAQNVLFNQELFSQLAKEAYNQKAVLGHKVFSNRVNIPISREYWLSILHVREYGDERRQDKAASVPNLTPVRWELVVALKQLLRENHHHRASLNSPHPATARFSETPEIRNAGAVPLKTSQLNQLPYDYSIFNRFFRKAKHIYNEGRLQQWLSDLCSSCSEPMLSVTWTPDLVLTSTTARLHLTDHPSTTPSRSLQLKLSVDEISVQQIEGETFTFPLEEQKLLRILKHQVVIHQMWVACQIVEGQKWRVLQQFTHPLLSNALAKSSGDYVEACSIVLESLDSLKKVDVLLEWGKVSVSVIQYASEVTTVEDVATVVPKSQNFPLDSQFGHDFQQRFTSMLNSLSSTH